LRFYPSSCTIYSARFHYLGVLASPLSQWLSPPCLPSFPQHRWPFLSKFLNLVFSKLDIRSSDGLCFPRATSPPSPVFQLPDATSRASFRLPRACAWVSRTESRFPRTGARISGASAVCLVALRSAKHWNCCFLNFFVVYLFLLLLCCLGFSLPLEETIVSGFMLVPLFFAFPDLDYYSTCTTSVTFGWLLLFPSGDTYRLALHCATLAFLTALCDPLSGPGHLFDQFPTFCNYFSIILVWFGSIIREPIHFSFLGSSTTFF
jgi:hypothetical protein